MIELFIALFYWLLQMLYIICSIILALYGIQSLWLTYQLWRYPEKYPQPHFNHVDPVSQGNSLVLFPVKPSTLPLEYPSVTVQLPIYNEHCVVERLIDACAGLDYPLDRLQIQVLDDSDDQTTSLANQRIHYWRTKQRNINLIRRAERSGYKAGALAYAFPFAMGEFLAIFDADFVPPTDFLKKTIPYFLETQNQQIGFVQARWEHLNRNYSTITQCQALALDAHFAVEQPGRQAAELPFGFNGSAGVWRRACIEDAQVGGWQQDTLCEDLDLSYRAWLAGWKGFFIADVAAPAEIPPQLAAFKRQQFRWAKGSIQTLCKLAARIWRSEWSLATRCLSIAHLGSYLLHPALLALLLLTLPLLFTNAHWPSLVTPLSITSLGTPFLYCVAQRKLHPQQWRSHLRFLPVLAVLGMGLCISNSMAVWQGISSYNSAHQKKHLNARQKGDQSGAFLRTPKFHVENLTDAWQTNAYRLPLDRTLLFEIGGALYALVALLTALSLGKWGSIPFMLMYLAGFVFVIFGQLHQAWSIRRITYRLNALKTS